MSEQPLRNPLSGCLRANAFVKDSIVEAIKYLQDFLPVPR